MAELHLHPDDPASVRGALNAEWLLTNGLGGYAMGSALGVNTRRYHGLLIAATKPPVGRIVALHSMIEELIIPGEDGAEKIIALSTQQFGDQAILHPEGWKTLASFHVDPPDRAEWNWRIGPKIIIKRTLLLQQNGNVAELSYEVSGVAGPFRLRLRPMTPLRDFHAIQAHGAPAILSAGREPRLTLEHEGITLQQWVDLGVWRTDPQWWHRFAYESDRSRGQEWLEDLWSPGVLEVEGIGALTVHLGFFVPSGSMEIESPNAHGELAASATSDHPAAARLRRSAGQFIVRRRMGEASQSTAAATWSTSIIAGYPWFGDWGRDTMISLPGLMLHTGRYEDARATLRTFAQHLQNGLIPNLFDDYGGAAHYNTVDASLWFVHAVHQVWKAAPQMKERVDGELLAACRQIIAAYRHGTEFNIRMDGDGLITAGDAATQLTWMDAKRDGVTFTPRYGKAVEINALWHNALRCVAEMSNDQAERDDLASLSRKAAESFCAKFWWPQLRCLHDVLLPNGDRPDGKLRPNQIFAVSLPFSPLDEAQQHAVVQTVGERLLTPYGLRTLDREDPDYRGRMEGDLFQRDAAYHQGTVWPWLIGPYCEALLRVNRFSAESKKRVRRIVQPLLDALDAPAGGCVGQIAEIYDGDPPHRPAGCPAQAWSVAEVLRALDLSA